MLYIVLALAMATAIPLLFLYLIHTLDLYASGSFRALQVTFIWGLVAFLIAYAANTLALSFVSMGLLILVVAPVLEELFKSLALVHYIRQPDFTYFVDGAIYGFAAGIAFSIFENYLYLARAPRNAGSLILVRAFSTCLMHGSASALVGVSLGRLRFGRGAVRIMALLLGWAAAIALHIGFNHVISRWSGFQVSAGAIAIGLAGVGLIALFIRWGLREEKRWIEETLGLSLGVTEREVEVVKRLDELSTLLAPVRQRFGPEKTALVEQLLLKQAQLGIKQKARELTPDEALRARMDAQIADLRRDMEALRRRVGVYCMIYVRSIFPPPSSRLWDGLAEALERQAASPRGRSLWAGLQESLEIRSQKTAPAEATQAEE